MFIDSHCHLDASEFDADRDATVNRALRSGVQLIIVPGVATSNFKTVADLASRHPAVYYALGIHPIFIPDAADADLETLEIAINKAMDDPKFIGIGEIGLDFFLPELCSDEIREKQIHFYSEQLRLAVQFDLPVILHVRRSVDLISKYLRRHPQLRGIAHAFNGSQQQAEILIEMGFKLGFGGAMTFSRAKQIRRLAAGLPLESIVLETDAPDIPPAWLGQGTTSPETPRNEPAELSGIAQCLAELRGETLQQIATQTSANVRHTFKRLPQFTFSD